MTGSQLITNEIRYTNAHIKNSDKILNFAKKYKNSDINKNTNNFA